MITAALCSATLEEKYTSKHTDIHNVICIHHLHGSLCIADIFNEMRGEQAGLSKSTLKTLLQDILLVRPLHSPLCNSMHGHNIIMLVCVFNDCMCSVQLPLSVSETAMFSQEIADPAVQSCWDTVSIISCSFKAYSLTSLSPMAQVHIEATALLSLEMFLGWITREPIAIVWLPTLHRLATAETGIYILHNKNIQWNL